MAGIVRLLAHGTSPIPVETPSDVPLSDVESEEAPSSVQNMMKHDVPTRGGTARMASDSRHTEPLTFLRPQSAASIRLPLFSALIARLTSLLS